MPNLSVQWSLRSWRPITRKHRVEQGVKGGGGGRLTVHPLVGRHAFHCVQTSARQATQVVRRAIGRGRARGAGRNGTTEQRRGTGWLRTRDHRRTPRPWRARASTRSNRCAKPLEQCGAGAPSPSPGAGRKASHAIEQVNLLPVPPPPVPRRAHRHTHLSSIDSSRVNKHSSLRRSDHQQCSFLQTQRRKEQGCAITRSREVACRGQEHLFSADGYGTATTVPITARRRRERSRPFVSCLPGRRWVTSALIVGSLWYRSAATPSYATRASPPAKKSFQIRTR